MNQLNAYMYMDSLLFDNVREVPDEDSSQHIKYILKIIWKWVRMRSLTYIVSVSVNNFYGPT